MIPYFFKKIFIWCSYLLLVGLPFFCFGLVFHSATAVWVGLALGVVTLVAILWFGFEAYLGFLGATACDSESSLGKSLERLRTELARSGVRASVEFWVYSSPEVSVDYWLGLTRTAHVFISQGALSVLSEMELRDYYARALEIQKDAALRRSMWLLQDQRSIARVFARLKGQSEGFRYWFLSFWLLPFEKALKFTVRA